MAERYPQLDLSEFLGEAGVSKYMKKLIKKGVRDTNDLIDVTPKILKEDIKMKSIEANRLLRKIDENLRIEHPKIPAVVPPIIEKPINGSDGSGENIPEDIYGKDHEQVSKEWEQHGDIGKIEIKYQIFIHFYPQQQTMILRDSNIRYYELVNKICQKEALADNMTVDLYTSEGYPLACSPSSYILKLSEWCLEGYCEPPLFYGIPRLRIYTGRPRQDTNLKLPNGRDVIAIENMDFLIQTKCIDATFDQLLYHLEEIIGLPKQLFSLHKRGNLISTPERKTLHLLGITNETQLRIEINKEFWGPMLCNNFSFKQYQPTWCAEQSPYGTSIFFSCLYTLFSSINMEHVNPKMLGHIRSLTNCPPLIHALNLLILEKNITLPHIVAIAEIMVRFFKVSKPKNLKGKSFKGDEIQDSEVTEHSWIFWAYLITRAKDFHKDSEEYESLTLFCPTSGNRMRNPVMLRNPNFSKRIIDMNSHRGDINEVSLVPKYKRLTTSFPMSAIEAIVWQGKQNRSYSGVEIQDIPDITHEWEELKTMFKSIPPLSIHSPLSVNTCTPPCIIPIYNRNMGLYTGHAKNSGPYNLYFDVISGEDKIFCAEELDKHVKMNKPKCFDEMTTSSTKYRGGMEILTRMPEEIIMVLLDTSYSMNGKHLEAKTKYDSVNEAFIAFSDRSRAYDMKHVIGLILFTENSKLVYPLSENFRDFSSKFSSLPSGSMTAVYDAIAFAVDRLNDFYATYPMYNQVPRRILCLTDGDDNRSNSNSKDAIRLLITNSIIMDTVLLTNEVVDTHLIAKASGGYSFQPKSSEELFNIFEHEPMLTMSMRKQIKPIFLPNDDMSLNKLHFNFDTNPEHKIPETQLQEQVVPIHSCLTFQKRQALCSGPVNSVLIKRLLQELAYFVTNPNNNFEIFPSENNIYFWQLLLKGPDGTNYENRLFRLYIEFSERYPKECPKIRFITPIYHCNINRAGRVCHAILDRNYNSDVRIKTILDYTCGLLMDPAPDDPLDSVKANQLRFDPELYNQMAKAHSEQNALNIRERTDVRSKILGTLNEKVDTIEDGAELVCPLTQMLFVEPMSTIYGDSYEREEILEHIRSGKEFDPFSRKLLKETDLFPNHTLKMLVEHYKEQINLDPLDKQEETVLSEKNRDLYKFTADDKCGMNIIGFRTENFDREDAKGIKCPLTNKLFENPVVTKEGYTYEKEAILQHIRSGNEFDPFTLLPLKEGDLQPDKRVKCIVDKYREDLNSKRYSLF